MGKIISNQWSVIGRPWTVMRAVFLVAATLLAGCKRGDQHVTDAALKQTFAARRDTFEKLAIMIRQDAALEQITFNSTAPVPAPVDAKRLGAYRQMLASIGCNDGLYREGSDVYFIASVNDSKTPGSKPSHKGFFHCPRKPSLIADKLDNYPWPEPENHVVYSPLEENWYLFVTRGGPQ